VARGLPQPVPDHGGLRVDTGSATERCRYVFSRAIEGLSELAHAITSPHVFLKLCDTEAEMLARVPARWRLQPASVMMICEARPDGNLPLPEGYRLELSTTGPVTAARILTQSGDIAASGYAAEFAGVFTYDRIVTDTAHRRRGLGRGLMAALGAARRSHAATEVLVATIDGQALYSTLGWMLYSPYTTAVIPG